jgi:hypothetical protein
LLIAVFVENPKEAAKPLMDQVELPVIASHHCTWKDRQTMGTFTSDNKSLVPSTLQ